MTNDEILSTILCSLRETHPELQVSITDEFDLKIVGSFETHVMTVK